MTIAEFDHLDIEHKKELLTQCCGSASWVNKMLAAPWVEDLVDLEEIAEEKWYQCTEEDWREAFDHHPKIGNMQSLKQKFSNTSDWAGKEQSGVNDADEKLLQELAEANETYEQKFGYIFIVCATGRTAGEMLDILKSRLPNSPEHEIDIAVEEQLKITQLRLEKTVFMSQITTHILDISKGKPVAGVRISLYKGENDEWTELSWGITDSDGRIKDLVKSSSPQPTGIYKLRFETKDYFDQQQIPTFYPFTEIVFDLTTEEHYHIPLLLSPFGYSTYRGS